MLESINNTAAGRIEKEAVDRVMRDAESNSMNIRKPYWRDEVREFMESRGMIAEEVSL